MNVGVLFRRHPIPTLATVAFVLSLATTVAFYAGLIPVVPKTLPLFVRLVVLTTTLFALAVLSCMISIALEYRDTATN
ncbi:MAG: hypothetical protein ACOCY7_04805 [Halodesulfurarchaeum sp.]